MAAGRGLNYEESQAVHEAMGIDLVTSFMGPEGTVICPQTLGRKENTIRLNFMGPP